MLIKLWCLLVNFIFPSTHLGTISELPSSQPPGGSKCLWVSSILLFPSSIHLYLRLRGQTTSWSVTSFFVRIRTAHITVRKQRRDDHLNTSRSVTVTLFPPFFCERITFIHLHQDILKNWATNQAELEGIAGMVSRLCTFFIHAPASIVRVGCIATGVQLEGAGAVQQQRLRPGEPGQK